MAPTAKQFPGPSYELRQVQMQIIVADIKQGSNWLFLQEEPVKWPQLYPTGSDAQWVFDNFLKSFELFIHCKVVKSLLRIHTAFSCLFYINIPRFSYHWNSSAQLIVVKCSVWKQLIKKENNLMANSEQTILSLVNVAFPFYRMLFSNCVCTADNSMYIIFKTFILHLLSWKLISDLLIYMYLFKKLRNFFIFLYLQV